MPSLPSAGAVVRPPSIGTRPVGLIKARKLKARDGGMLLELLVTGQSVIPPTTHPETGEPYAWLTEYSLLDVNIDELPVLPS
jgi:hypothetical protein